MDEKTLDPMEITRRMISDFSDDREELLNFTRNLIKEFQGDVAVTIAEPVAKLFSELTRQQNTKIAFLKSIGFGPTDESEEEDEMSSLSEEIGLPFSDEHGSSSN